MTTPDLSPAVDDRAPAHTAARRDSLTARANAHREQLGWAVLALGTFLLGLDVIGIPALVVLAGAWLLAAALHYGFTGIAGPAAWAGGAIAEVSLLGAGSAALAIVSPHNHGTAVNLAVLLAPAVVGAIGLTIAIRYLYDRTGAARRGRPHLAIIVHLAVFVVARWISTDRWHNVAWAMNGDARNHVLLMRSLLSGGGISISVLRTYPALVDGIAALISGGGHRTGLAPGTLLIHDAAAVSATYVIAAVGVGCLLVATLAEVLPEAMAFRRRLPAGVVLVMLAAAATAGTPLLLGTSVKDGYLSAYGSLPLAIAACALAVRCCARPAPITLALLGPACIVTFLGWTLLAVVPAALLVVALVFAIVPLVRGHLWNWAWVLAIVVGAGCLIGLAGVVLGYLTTLKKTFVVSGAITSPQPKTLTLLGLLLIGAICVAREQRLRRQLIGPLLAVGASLVTVRWLQSVASSPVPTYYSAKTLYLVVSSLVWIPFALVLPAMLARAEVGTTSRRIRSGGMAIASVAWSVAVFIVLNLATTLGNPLTKAHDGLTQPSPVIIHETAKIANGKKPFIFWNWSDPGNERLANFWAFTTWDTTAAGADKNIGTSKALPNGVLYWGYVEGDTLPDLCSITTAIPGLVVVTANGQLGVTLKRACPKAKPKILLQAYPS